MIRFHVCPDCGEAKVESGELVGGAIQVACTNCGWIGKHEDLLEIRDGRTPQRIAEDVSREYMRLLAKYAARPIGLTMAQAGIVGVRDPKNIARLIKAACKGAHRATLEEVEKIQEELLDGREQDVH